MAVFFSGKTSNKNYVFGARAGRPDRFEFVRNVGSMFETNEYLVPETTYVLDLNAVISEAMATEYSGHREDLVYTVTSSSIDSSRHFLHSDMEVSFLSLDTNDMTITIEAPDTSGRNVEFDVQSTVNIFDPVSNTDMQIAVWGYFFFAAVPENISELLLTEMFYFIEDEDSFIEYNGEMVATQFILTFSPLSNHSFSAYQDIILSTPSTNHIYGGHRADFERILQNGVTFNITGIAWRGTGSVDSEGYYSGIYQATSAPLEDWVEDQEGEITFEYEGYSATYPFFYQINGSW